MLRDRLFETLESEEEIDESGFALEMTRLEPGQVGDWLADTRAATGSGSAYTSRARGAPARATSPGVAFATADGTAAHVAVETITPEDDAALVSWLGDPDQPKVLHDAKGPMLALAARGWPLTGLERDTALSAYLARPDQRSYDLADLTVRYLKRELKPGTSDDGQLSLDGRRRREQQRRRRCCTPARCSTSRRRSTTSSPSAAAPACSPTSSCRSSTCSPASSRSASPSTTTSSSELEEGFAVRVRDAAEAAYAVDRQGDQPRLAQAAAGGAVRRAGDAEDQAHQDRLHHRRRRAAGPLREDRAPVPRAPARAPRRHPAAADRAGPAQDGGRGRPDPHHVQPADRGHRAALQHRPQPAEHPGPHRGRPPHPRGASWSGAGLRRAADRRLLPDRDADHGAPLRGRRPDRGVPVRHRLPLGHGGAGLRRRARRGHRRDARQDQGDELRPGLRARPRSVSPSSCASTPPRRAA